ncbi:MAG: phosphotransferase [Acidimicrobiia bacterium]|nr:phosphotransferase [Acidimicrobiia bacterium]
MANRYKIMGPNRLLNVPTWSRPAAHAGLMMYTACRPRPLLAQRLAWLAVSVLGPKVLPGRSVPFESPVDGETWMQLSQRWTTTIGPFTGAALQLRRPADRTGSSLILLNEGSPTAFVKLRPDDGETLAVEKSVLDALERRPPQSFEVARVLDAGTVGDWHFLAMSPLPVRIHTVPPKPDLAAIADEISHLLADDWGERPAGIPETWVPIHGDFTPWNLRASGGHTVLFDWEQATWAPPTSDLVWWDTSVKVLDLPVTRSGVEHTEEAKRYWVDRLGGEVAAEARDLRGFVLRDLSAQLAHQATT